jgi:sensor histidine kinase YesM
MYLTKVRCGSTHCPFMAPIKHQLSSLLFHKSFSLFLFPASLPLLALPIPGCLLTIQFKILLFHPSSALYILNRLVTSLPLVPISPSNNDRSFSKPVITLLLWFILHHRICYCHLQTSKLLPLLNDLLVTLILWFYPALYWQLINIYFLYVYIFISIYLSCVFFRPIYYHH